MVAHYGSFESSLLLLKLRQKPLNILIYGTKFGGNRRKTQWAKPNHQSIIG